MVYADSLLEVRKKFAGCEIIMIKKIDQNLDTDYLD